MIQEIDVKLLHHHPQNPRKDLGDLTELSDSIKEQGIFQNLTVVPIPNDIGYYVVIGNRRLEASKLAGLQTLPCVIATDMDEQTQQAVMLLENMQRNDLTLYEQAQGFQMCLDLGMSQDELKTKTGFSKKTIKQRLTLLKFDQHKVKDGVTRGATLQDYMDLEQVEDEVEKEKLLDIIGTGNFRYQLNTTIQKIENKKAKDAFVEKLLSSGIQQVDEQPSGYTYSQCFYSKGSYDCFNLPDNPENYAFECNSTYIYLYKKFEEKQENISVEEDSEPTETELKRQEIKEKVYAAYQTRLNYVKEAYKSMNFADIDMMKKLMCYTFEIIDDNIYRFYNHKCKDLFQEITGKSMKDLQLLNKEETSIKTINRNMFVYIYSQIEDDSNAITLSYRRDINQYENNYEEIKTLYEFLEAFGYNASSDELDIMYGVHELYDEPNEDLKK